MSFIRLLFALGLVLPALAAAATPNAATATSPDTTSLPYVTRISTLPEHPNPFEPTRLVIEGQYPNLCGELLDPGVAGTVVFLNARTDCRDPLFEGWRKEFDLGQLAAGTHQVQITLMVMFPGAIDPDVYYAYHTFFVSPDSVHGPLPYVDEIRILNGRTGQPGPLCSTDSILVRTSGTFPSTCYALKAIELLPSPIAGGPLPQPPVVRYVIEQCSDQVCLGVLVPWDAYVMLPPLPASPYYPLFVQVAEVACGDSVHPDTPIASTIVPFRVSRCDSTPVESCVRGDWQHPGGACDASIHEGHAQVTFTVQTGKNLAGLQGAFSVHPPGLRIARLDAIGPAEGMHVSWRATPDGVRFNMFADQGAPIPAVTIGNPDGGPVPILRVTLQAVQRPVPEVTWVSARDLFGSDEHGNGVPQCLIFTPVVIAARVCAERGCDFNADGSSDVRDLVLMARCVFGTAQDSAGNVYRQMCADSASVPDCNADGQKSIADAVCCALKILRGSDCPDCPVDSTGGRPAPNVRVALRDPEITATGADVIVDVEGLNDVGGAVLSLAFPADRYSAEVSLPGVGYGWLNLSDVLNGTATIALVRASDPLGPIPLVDFAPAEPMKLRLTLKPGQRHGGVVKLERFEVSDPDGAKLIPGSETAVVPLGGAARIALSEARPNPFSGESRFRLTLDRPSDVSVAIYDLGGRLVTTLHRGHLGAGTHDFAWNGTQKSGATLPGGVYFYRAIAGTASASRKLVLLGN